MKILFLGTDGIDNWKEIDAGCERAYYNAFDEPEDPWVQENCKAYTSVHEAIGEFHPDLAVIGVPNYRKLIPSQLQALLKQKVKLYIQKFRLTDPSDFETILLAARENETDVYIGEFYRDAAVVRTAKSLNSKIGKVEVRWWRCAINSNVFWPWEHSYADLAQDDLGFHHFSAIESLVGMDVTSVYARSLSPVKGQPMRGTVSMAILTTREGCIINHSINWHNSGNGTDYMGDFVLEGEKGCITAQNGRVYLTYWGQQRQEAPLVPERIPAQGVLPYLMGEEQERPLDIEQFAPVMRSIRAALTSARENRVIHLDLP